MADRELTERLTAAIADAETAQGVEPDWVRHRAPSVAPAAVYSVRIPVDRIEELRALAATRQIPPTVLIRRWVLAQLDAAKDANDYAQRWERDVRATAAHLQKLLDERPHSIIADAS
jgi:hypothetical protein